MEPIQRIAQINADKAAKSLEDKRYTEGQLANIQSQEVIVRSFKSLVDFLDGKITKTQVVNQIKSVATPDALKVADAVNDLHKTLKTHKNTDLSEVTKVMKGILAESKKIPKQRPKPEKQQFIDYTKQFKALGQAVKAVEKVVKAQKLIAEAPIVNVPETKVQVDAPDLRPLQDSIRDVVKAVTKIVIPKYKTDNKEVEKLIKASNKLLKGILKKPVGGGGGGGQAWTAVNPSGIPMPLNLDADGNLKIGATDLDIRDLDSATDSVTAVPQASVPSTVNSTTTPLADNATFTGTWEDITDYDFIEATLYTDQNSATNGAKLQFSTDGGTTTEKQLANTLTGGLGAYSYSIPVTAFTHFRIVYTNGVVTQTAFRLRVVKQKGSSPVPIAPLGAGIDATYSAMLTRAVLAGQLPSGAVQNLSVNASGYQEIAIAEHDAETPIKALTSIKATQQTIATTATQITSSPLASRKTISIKLKSSATQKVYIGEDNTVTISTGYELNAGDSVDIEVDGTSTIWAIADTSSQTVCLMEIA